MNTVEPPKMFMLIWFRGADLRCHLICGGVKVNCWWFNDHNCAAEFELNKGGKFANDLSCSVVRWCVTKLQKIHLSIGVSWHKKPNSKQFNTHIVTPLQSIRKLVRVIRQCLQIGYINTWPQFGSTHHFACMLQAPATSSSRAFGLVQNVLFQYRVVSYQ